MNIFKHVGIAPKVKRATFNMSHDVKLTTNFGNLTPFFCEEVMPNDTWKIDSKLLVRFAPLIAPVMHDITATIHFFYVPFRLLWNGNTKGDNFEDFITGGELGEYVDEEHEPVLPRLYCKVKNADPKNQFGVGSLADYLNYPTNDSNISGHVMVSALPLRAYQLIWNEYYRDENLIEKLDISLNGGEIQTDSDEYDMLLTLRKRAWAKDYFTSALPWPQKGDTQDVPVFGSGELNPTENIPVTQKRSQNPQNVSNALSGDILGFLAAGESSGVGNSKISVDFVDSVGNVSEGTPLQIDPAREAYVDKADAKGVKVDLSGLSFGIFDLRRAEAIQRWMERNARGGTRYIETLLSRWGVISDDARLQRPEFLGGGTTPVTISDVLQTSQTTETSPQAQYAGIGFAFGNKNIFKRTFKERGLILGILSVMPKPAYSEGIPRMLKKFSKYDFAMPEFAHLGEQEIYNYEVACRGEDLYGTFGYAPRYAEYKYIPSRVHGEFKTTLKFWNLNRHFENQPNLTSEFIQCDDEANQLNRIFAVEDSTEHHLFCQIQNHVVARRPMPYLPDPRL